MAIRDTLNEKKGIVIGVVVLLVVVAGWVLISNMGGSSTVAGDVYFTDDDGQTWFSGSASDISPMERGGKTAVRAYVFECEGSGKFVGYMEKLPDEVVGLIRKARENPDAVTSAEKGKLMSASQMRQVKKPGDAKWVQAGPVAPRITCPDGSLATSAN